MKYRSLAFIMNSGIGNQTAMKPLPNTRTQLITHGGDHGDNDGGWAQVSPQKRRGRKLSNRVGNHNAQNLESGTKQESSTAFSSAEDSFQPFMIVLVGVPGSGKSTFADMLVKGNPSRYVRVNQDKLKTRKKCERLCRGSLQKGKVPIIDRCNFDPSQRQHFLSIANDFGIPVDCIVFSYSMQVCLTRCQERVGHETITQDNARMVVRRMMKDFSPPLPDNQDEIFRAQRTVTAFQDAKDIVSEYLNEPE